MQLRLTCIFNIMPSPLLPPIVAVTMTSWSRATKLRMHRSFDADSCPGCAWISNLSAATRGKMKASSSLNVNMTAIVVVVVISSRVGCDAPSNCLGHEVLKS